MGNLFAKPGEEFDGDFEGLPNSDSALSKEAEEGLAKAQQTMASLQQYFGCQNEIREHISKPSEATERAVWEALKPVITEQLKFWQTSQDLVAVINKLLQKLTPGQGQKASAVALEHQGLVYMLGRCLALIHEMDHVKMMCPQMQNDFAHYRRVFQKMRATESDFPVEETTQQVMSMFLAEATPMLKTLRDSTKQLYNKDPRVLEVLAVTSNTCATMIKKKQYSNPATITLCYRMSVEGVVLYDLVHPLGAFSKKSPFQLKAIINECKQAPEDIRTQLLSSLQYSTVHLKDPTTPSSIQKMLQ